MIQAKRGGRTEYMTKPESFDEFYTHKLEALAISLKAVIKGDLPYACSAEYACHACKSRIKLHSQGHILCMRCCMSPDLMPSGWSRELRREVFRLLQSYPSLEDSMQEWDALQRPPEPRTRKQKYGDEELGKRIRAARESLGLSQDALARQIYQTSGKEVARASIQAYENANSRPSEHVLNQLVEILGL